MKKVFFVLLVMVSVGFGQRVSEKIVANDDTLLIGRSYAIGGADTSRAIDVRFADDYFVGIVAYDSAVIYIDYQVSHNKSTWSAKQRFDSLVTVSNSGGYDVFDLTNIIRGTMYLRLIFTFSPSSAAHGTTTNRYDAIASRRED